MALALSLSDRLLNGHAADQVSLTSSLAMVLSVSVSTWTSRGRDVLFPIRFRQLLPTWSRIRRTTSLRHWTVSDQVRLTLLRPVWLVCTPQCRSRNKGRQRPATLAPLIRSLTRRSPTMAHCIQTSLARLALVTSSSPLEGARALVLPDENRKG